MRWSLALLTLVVQCQGAPNMNNRCTALCVQLHGTFDMQYFTKKRQLQPRHIADVSAC